MKTIEEITDAVIRQRLAEAAPPALATEGWDALERRMDAVADAHLRAALSGLPPTAPRGWETLANRLDGRPATDLDVADKLNSLQPTPATGAWAAFATSLDVATEAAVDEIVVEQLHKVPAATPTGWAALAARLELIRERRGRVVAGKITELALMASVLLLFVRFGAFTSQPELIAMDEPELRASFNIATAAPVSAKNIVAAPTTAQDPTRVNQAATPQATIEPAPAAPGSASGRESTGVEQVPQVAASGLATTSSYEESLIGAVALSSVPADQLARAVSKPRTLRILTTYGKVEHTPDFSDATLSAPLIEASKVPTHLYVNGFVSPFDVNQVVTRNLAVLDLDIEGDNRITQGQSAGLLFDLMRGRSGLQFGVVYSEMSYIPSALKWYLQEDFTIFEPVKGYSRFEFKRIDLPLSFNQTVADNGRWRWTARATASLSVIAAASFKGENEDDIRTLNERVLSNPNYVPVSSTNGSGARSENPQQKKARELVDPSPGILQRRDDTRGSFSENASFYLGGGIMLERILTPRSSVYLNPSFGRVIYLNVDDEEAGVGPYQDRMHSGQLRVGARYLLSGK